MQIICVVLWHARMHSDVVRCAIKQISNRKFKFHIPLWHFMVTYRHPLCVKRIQLKVCVSKCFPRRIHFCVFNKVIMCSSHLPNWSGCVNCSQKYSITIWIFCFRLRLDYARLNQQDFKIWIVIMYLYWMILQLCVRTITTSLFAGNFISLYITTQNAEHIPWNAQGLFPRGMVCVLFFDIVFAQMHLGISEKFPKNLGSRF